ncbi:arginine--tRNA ligase [Adhaeretor mobilis]|uniref:Arginine--tRNA ligase n=1 Tax=Adhaeretor mobilis TaxID=1930276 RepID=A0A517MRD3_9BACT|nr:arginine--tRNA ligase [Adhaeretor mobilis]QDS97429.1 Arginine--tRNA ligase [Adhaeretor mobilis]
MNLLAELRSRFATALESLDGADLSDMVLPSQDPKFGDYQANCAMPLGKRLGRPPREIATELVEKLGVADLCEPPEIAGPGFINLRVKTARIAELVGDALVDEHRLGVPTATEPRNIVLDYSSPNVAKPMHVGHIRSTVIGDALAQVLKFLGHKVITDNHIGDWGTQFGMIVYGYKNFGDDAKLAEAPVGELTRLYRFVNSLVDYHALRTKKIPEAELAIDQQQLAVEKLSSEPVPEDQKAQKKAAKKLRQAEGLLNDCRSDLVALQQKLVDAENDEQLISVAKEHADIGQKVLAETAALHAGDEENVALWKRFLPACLAEMDAIYERLNVSFDHTLGESHYHDQLAETIASLEEQGLVKVSDGAKCVFLEGQDAPFIVQKRDGAFLYATTDLATIKYRVENWQPDALLYVVDHRQSLHFEHLFATTKLWGEKDTRLKDLELEHISFGTVLGEDGKPYKTRSGTAVGLSGLLDEAIQRALAIVSENDDARAEPLLSAEERQTVADRIGIGAIKYADLAHNRTSDYVFSYDKMLAMTGNTAAYMQYSYARVSSIFGKAGVDRQQLRTSNPTIDLNTPAERSLALALLQFSEALTRVASDYRPNHLTSYLFELASKYSSFFSECPVLKAESDELRTSRLALCDLTARTLSRGLELLGIEVVERM